MKNKNPRQFYQRGSFILNVLVLQNQHGITISPEAVFFFDGFFICFHKVVETGKASNHHLECRKRQMKLVTIRLATLKSYGGKMNLLVQPSYGFKCPWVDTELSMVRITVVPTAQMFLRASRAALQPGRLLPKSDLFRIHFVFGQVLNINAAEVT